MQEGLEFGGFPLDPLVDEEIVNHESRMEGGCIAADRVGGLDEIGIDLEGSSGIRWRVSIDFGVFDAAEMKGDLAFQEIVGEGRRNR
jgi:hypothetical protein